MRHSPDIIRLTTALVGPLLLGACATVDFDYPKEPSSYVENSAETYLGEVTRAYELTHPGMSGFELQFDGVQSLAARLALADAAELSIDTQYYLIKDDLIGYVFIGALLEAADRGVRVRLLLDDIFTQGYDAGFAALDSHPNFEVRLFNPFGARSFRFNNLFSYKRLNRRMHTKSFTVDNEVTILGGRNIADEYYGARHDVNFGDIDVMGIGPVVSEVSAMFDEFWNSRLSLPVAAVVDMPDDPAKQLEALRTKIVGQLDAARGTQYADAVTADFDDYLVAEADDLFSWTPYVLAYDSPGKADTKQTEVDNNIVDTLAEAVDAAQNQLIILSPYFVPTRKGIEYFKGLRDRGLEIVVITNSLAANNHTIAHSGYAPYRKKLLEIGVQIFEVKATAKNEDLERAGTENSLATLHSKAFMVDDSHLFVGSFNWDPRSVNLNTEIGVILNSPEFVAEGLARLERGEVDNAYEVVIDETGNVRWIDRSGGQERVLTKEPDTSWGKRTGAALGELLPIRGQL
jgi:putative cardiolipin synthase